MSGESVKESWGYACPSCGSDESIDVDALISVRLLPNNESDLAPARDQSWDWDSSKYASCVCGFGAPLGDFSVDQ